MMKLSSLPICCPTLALIFSIWVQLGETKVVEFGAKLPELVRQHSDKHWLVNFYIPGCYHCQQFEPTYESVADDLHRNHHDTVVGRIDCTKFTDICRGYGVEAFPSIHYIGKDTQEEFKKERSLRAIVEFATRMKGPSVRTLGTCNHLSDAMQKHEITVLMVGDGPEQEALQNLSVKLKSDHWIYSLTTKCMNLDNGLYMMKRNLEKPLKFQTDTQQALQDAVHNWIRSEHFPVFGPINSRDIERATSFGKLVVVAILEDYRGKITKISRHFHDLMKGVAKNFAKSNNQVIFGWSGDVPLFEYIEISRIETPSLMFMRSGNRRYLFGRKSSKEGLNESNIVRAIGDVMSEKLKLYGGEGYLEAFLRGCFRIYHLAILFYERSPPMTFVLLILPFGICGIVIYTTCCRDDPTSEEDGEDEALINASNSNHVKQD